MSAVSPSSSPRLPSPPPMAEDQTGPTSPSVSLFEDSGNYLSKPPRLSFGNGPDTGASRRIRPGTKAEDMAEGPPLVEMHEIDSAFQLTEHLAALHNTLTHPNTTATTPITHPNALKLAYPPANTAREIWLYELARFLIQKTNAIIITLFTDTPPCSPQTCPEMRASEWQYLCSVHDPPKSCSAIDYCCHTLDWAASTLCNSKLFPSRLNLGAGGAAGGDKVLNHQMKELTNIFRRVYRIYAHAWFQHREVFWRVEGKTGLYGFFKTVCEVYGLIQHENYTIPPEAEGLEPPVKEEGREREQQQQQQSAPSLLKRSDEVVPEPKGEKVVAMGDTTKRHRHTMSSDSRASSVSTTIAEEAEEDEEAVKPGLERAATTILTDDAAAGEAESTKSEKVEEDVAAEPELGISRSETVKPPKDENDDESADEVAVPEGKAEEAEETDPEVTVVEAEVPEEEVEKDDVKVEGQESKIEIASEVKEDGEKEDSDEKKDETVMESAESGAADGEEATKTVAD